jgi:SAM-dependent methyltransferase
MISSSADEVGRGAEIGQISVHGSALDAMSQAENYHDWIVDSVLAFIGPRVVEIGGGIGSIAHALRDRERLVILDKDPVCCRRLERRFAARGNIRVLEGDILDPAVAAGLGGERLDTVVCVNVLEHIDEDIQALRGMHEILQPGGHLIVFVPALPLLYGPLDVQLGHRRRYRRGELRDKVASVGFSVERCRFFNGVGAVSWFVAGRLRRQRTIRVDQVRLYDRLVVPAVSRAENIIPPPFGQSLMLFARK